MNEKLLLQDLVALLADRAEMTQKDADRFYRELFQLILDRIYEQDIVKVKGLGTFKLVLINARESVDVNTGEKIEIPSHLRMSFAPDNSLKELLNRPFAHFESVLLDDDIPLTDAEGTNLSYSEYDEPCDDGEFLEEELESESLIQRFIRDDVISDKYNKSNAINNTRITSSLDVSIRHTQTESKTIQNKESVDRSGDITGLDEGDRNPSQPIDSADVSLGGKSENEILLPTEVVETDLFLSDKDRHNPDDDRDITNSESGSVQDGNSVESNIDFSQNSNEDKAFFEAYGSLDDSAYQIDYERQARVNKRKKQVLIVAVSVLVGAFAIYQFAKLFDVTYDYEYYINRNYNLTLTDTLPYLDQTDSMDDSLTEKTTADALAENLTNVKPDSNNSNELADTNLPYTPLISRYNDDGILKERASDLDSIIVYLNSKNKLPRKKCEIADDFEIEVTNKAELFLTSQSN